MLDLLGLNYFVKAHGPGELANSRHPAEYLPRQPFGHEILTVNFGDRLATVLGQKVWKRSHKQLHTSAWVHMDSTSDTVELSL